MRISLRPPLIAVGRGLRLWVESGRLMHVPESSSQRITQRNHDKNETRRTWGPRREAYSRKASKLSSTLLDGNDRTVIAQQGRLIFAEPARHPIFKRAYFPPATTSKSLSTNRWLANRSPNILQSTHHLAASDGNTQRTLSLAVKNARRLIGHFFHQNSHLRMRRL